MFCKNDLQELLIHHNIVTVPVRVYVVYSLENIIRKVIGKKQYFLKCIDLLDWVFSVCLFIQPPSHENQCFPLVNA